MKKYIVIELIEAEPMTQEEFLGEVNPETVTHGYKVRYADGHETWQEKNFFEKINLQVGDNNTIEERNINDFIKSYDVSQWGDKTTMVHATLANGFVMSEASSCVDPANFNMNIGASICKERIHNKLWNMLGFMLQAAIKGVK